VRVKTPLAEVFYFLPDNGASLLALVVHSQTVLHRLTPKISPRTQPAVRKTKGRSRSLAILASTHPNPKGGGGSAGGGRSAARWRKARWWRRLDGGWRGDAGRPAASSGDERAGRPSAGGSAARVRAASVRRVRRRGQQAAGAGGWATERRRLSGELAELGVGWRSDRAARGRLAELGRRRGGRRKGGRRHGGRRGGAQGTSPTPSRFHLLLCCGAVSRASGMVAALTTRTPGWGMSVAADRRSRSCSPPAAPPLAPRCRATSCHLSLPTPHVQLGDRSQHCLGSLPFLHGCSMRRRGRRG
jgi:hypothetical protein